jgi:hypothetical protein
MLPTAPKQPGVGMALKVGLVVRVTVGLALNVRVTLGVAVGLAVKLPGAVTVALKLGVNVKLGVAGAKLQYPVSIEPRAVKGLPDAAVDGMVPKVQACCRENPELVLASKA